MTKKEKQTTYVERDVSWMYFNHRILQEAEKPTVPLLERLSFLGKQRLNAFFVEVGHCRILNLFANIQIKSKNLAISHCKSWRGVVRIWRK